MIFDPTPSDLHHVWRIFIDFEGFNRQPDRDLNHFIEEWKEKIAKVHSTGCQYSDLLLGLKLLEKINLSHESLLSVFSKLSSSTSVSESFLTRVVNNIKELGEINGSTTNQVEGRLANIIKTNEDDQEISEELESKTNLISYDDEFSEEAESKANLISCSKCPQSFFDLESLSKHFHEFHPDMTNAKVISSKMGTRSDSGFLKCPICDKNFMTMETLKKHVSNHDNTMFGSGQKAFLEQGWFDSSEIDTVNKVDARTLTSDGMINDQMIKTEPCSKQDIKPGKTFKCNICSKEFSKLWKVTAHMTAHSETKDYKCPYCDITYKWKSNLRKHLLHSHLEEQRKQKIIEANSTQDGKDIYQLDDTPELKMNIKTEPGSKPDTKTEKTFKCTICPKEFTKSWYVTEHMRVHIASKEYKCPYCDKTYKWKRGLNNHLLVMHLDEKQHLNEQGTQKVHKLPCEICGKPISMFNIKTHIKYYHPEKFDEFVDCPEEDSKLKKPKKIRSKIHPCSICQKVLTTAHVLKLHMETHKTTKDYICSYCGKEYKTLNVLKEHMNLHTKARTLPCEYCGKTFLAYAARAFHIRKYHTGERPYKCDFCDRRFLNQGKKTYHERTHTGEKPFSCPECGKCFSEPGSYQRHLKNVHKIINSNRKK